MDVNYVLTQTMKIKYFSLIIESLDVVCGNVCKFQSKIIDVVRKYALQMHNLFKSFRTFFVSHRTFFASIFVNFTFDPTNHNCTQKLQNLHASK